MLNKEIMIIGAGSAGVNAAVTAASSGAKVLLVTKGHQNADALKEATGNNANIEIWAPATAVGYYEDNVVTVLYQGKHIKVKPQRLIVATGSMENFAAFVNNDLPGILSAKTAYKMMSEYGVLPAQKVLIAGDDSYGKKMAEELGALGVEVKSVPLCALKAAVGEDRVTGAVVVDCEGGEETVSCEAILVAAGCSPVVDLITLTECKMAYVEELSGYVPETDENMATSRSDVFCAGSAAGIESEAAAELQGKIAGYSAAISLGYDKVRMIGFRKDVLAELDELREGPAGAEIRAGHEQFSIR